MPRIIFTAFAIIGFATCAFLAWTGLGEAAAVACQAGICADDFAHALRWTML